MALADRVAKAAAPLLESGETLEVATVAAVGKVSLKRQIATAAVTAVLSAGMASVVTYARKLPVVLTNRRLLFLDANEITGRPQEKLVGSVPREGLRAQRQRAVLWLVYNLIDNTGAPVLRLSFPLPNRSAGHKIAESLGLLGSA